MIRRGAGLHHGRTGYPVKTYSWRPLPAGAIRGRKGRTKIALVLVTLLALALGVLGAGPATAAAAKTTICHRTGNGTSQEISVANSAVRAHLAHGDTVGPCRPADTTKPTVTLTNPADGRSYDQGAEVLAEYTCADEAGGSGLASCAGPAANGAAIDTATLGEHEFTVTARDNAGNETVVTHAYTVTNGSDPVITVTSPVLGEDGGASTYVVGDTVLVDYSCAAQPGGAAIVSCTGNIADGDPLDTSQWRAPAYLVVDATDNAGRSTRSITPYIVKEADVTAPVVSLSSPNDLDVYAQGAEVVADFGCDDAYVDFKTLVSGVATCDGTEPAGELIDTATLGEHEFTVTTRDNAGNETVVTHTYTVVDPSLLPVITITSPPDLGDDGPVAYRSDAVVIAEYHCEAQPGGAPIVDCAGRTGRGASVANGARIDLTSRFRTLVVSALDAAGNEVTVQRSFDVYADFNAPDVSLATPADGEFYEQGAEVLASYGCSEPRIDPRNSSGVATCDGTVADGEPIDTSTLGEHSFTVTTTDRVGNRNEVTVTYTVVEADETAPTVTVANPVDGATYAQGEEVVADYTCADEGSGLATCEALVSIPTSIGSTDARVADGALTDTQNLGEHTFYVFSTDRLGNETTVIYTYWVV